MKKFFTFTLILTLVFVLGMLTISVAHSLENKTPESYYLEAEILSQENGEIIFCTKKGNFSVKDKVLNPDTEYLLTMISNGTKTPKDDEICVIWEVK